MIEPAQLQAALRLIRTLGPSAFNQATQNALDMRAGGDASSESFWLDVVDVIASMQTRSRVEAPRAGLSPSFENAGLEQLGPA